MSEYLRPEYTPLFTQVQDFIADQLNTDPQLSALGIEFLPEHRLDIEYEIKNNLGKQGTVGIVNTLKGTYGGHNGSTNAWEIEAEVDVLENPPVRRAQMKKMGLSAGSTADILDWVQESLCAPSSPTYGKFCAMSQELGEDRGIIVGRSIMKTFAIADISAVVSGEHQWVCPYALLSDLTALQEQVYDLSVDVHGDYIEDENGNRIDADLSFTNPNWTGWRIDGSDELLKGTKDLANDSYMYPDPQEGDEYYQISFDSQTSTWTLWMFYWLDGAWGTERTATASGTIDDTTIEFTGWKTLVQETTNKTIATTDEIPTKVSQLQNDSGFITSANVPTKTSDLTNDSGFVTSTELENGVEKLVEDANDEYSTRVVVDEYDNVLVQKYTTGWYVSKIEVAFGASTDYTETNDYYAYLTDVRLDTEEGRLYFTTVAQDKQRNLSPYKRSNFTPNYSTGEFITYSSWTATQTGGQAITLHLTVTNAETPVWVNIARLVPDSAKRSGLLDTQITPYGQFLTPTQVKPYEHLQGYARRAQGSLFMFGRSDMLTPDENHFVTIDYNVGKLCYVGQTQYPWQLSMYNGTTFDPPIQMNYGYYENVRIKVNGRIRNFPINSNCWLGIITVDSRNTRPCYIKGIENENGSVVADNNFYYYGASYPITFSANNLSIDTIDGVEGGITCTRQGTGTHQTEFKYFAYEDSVPTKTSDLTNDSGFITSADIITKRALSDFNVYVDPMANMTTTKFTVVVSYAGDPTYPLFTAELPHTGGDAATWSWSPSGSNQSISIDYSSVTGAYTLHYYNLQDGGGNEHSGGMNLPLTSPYWTGEAQDDWFHFSITSQTTTIATKEYVDAQIGQVLSAQF